VIAFPSLFLRVPFTDFYTTVSIQKVVMLNLKIEQQSARVHA
jgi:hypothetical protein